MSDRKEDRIVMGKFGAPHGVRGALKLYSYTEDPEAIFDYDLHCVKAGGDITLSMQSAASDFYIVTLPGINSREKAADLTHGTLTVSRDALPDIDSDEEGEAYYHADLIGLNVQDSRSGEMIGSVVAAHNFGAGDILEIKPVGKGATFMIPFDNNTVPHIDIAAGILHIVDEDTSDAGEGSAA